uniref:Short chain dehydrogenase n=1 Tax=Paulinella longichromatophora TaxID=1708747 RepID=A0A2H4ZNC5_9EUKA|nr:short chain dehydrogenase [Paulinella longichromatophora]
MVISNFLENRILPLRGIRVGISGANGALGQALLKSFYNSGAHVVGITSSRTNTKVLDDRNHLIPVKWAIWKCGEEKKLASFLKEIDLLIINHGTNNYKQQYSQIVSTFMNVNAISSIRLLNLAINQTGWYREIWINTSEAEVQPAFSPLYEISKRLIGQLSSLYNCGFYFSQGIRIRKLVLGPFNSRLNPIGIMTPDFVAQQIIYQAKMGMGLIIVSPNPLTYVLMPIVEFTRWIYYTGLMRKVDFKSYDQSIFHSHQKL